MSKLFSVASRFLAATLFSLSCTVVAFYAFAYLYEEYNPHHPFHVAFARTGWAVPAHFFAAGFALLISPLQISAWLRAHFPSIHRSVGWVYLSTVTIGGLSGIVMAFYAQGGWSTGSAFLSLALLWLGTTWIGAYYAVRRRFALHRLWLLRSLALTFTGVTLRIWLGLGLGPFELPFATAYIIAAWVSWPLNLLIVEIYIRRTGLVIPMTAQSVPPVADTRLGSHPGTA